jgi:Siphovirus Gp157
MPDLHRSVANFRAALDDIRRAYPAEEDAEALTTTALGETTLEEDILRTLREALAREAMADGIDELIQKLISRRTRLNHGAEHLRAACLHAMQEAGIDRLRGPDMTVSVGLSPPKVIVTDPFRLPSKYRRRPPWEPDKKAIAEAMTRGEKVRGAEMGNRAPFLRISTK